MTLYRVYVENGNRAGFWVQHRDWANACAKVHSIAGRREGKLPGIAPSYDDAAVSMHVFDVRSGRPVDLQAAINSTDRHFTRIAEPPWHEWADARLAQV